MNRKEEALKSINLLDLAPVRLASWTRHADGVRVVLQRPVPSGRGVRAFFRRLSFALAPSRMRLDPIGSFLWERLDGNSTVAQLSQAARQHFGQACEPAEERVGQLIRILRHEGFLAFPGWDEIPPRAG